MKFVSFPALVALVVLGDLQALPLPVREGAVTDYHGTKVADPFRFLEDTKDEKVAAWAQAQGEDGEVLMRIDYNLGTAAGDREGRKST